MNKVKSITTIAGVAVATLGFLAPSASAAPTTWTISPSGANFSGDAETTTLTDNNGNQVTCATADASGTLANSPVSGNPATLATITTAHFNTPCDGPLGSSWTVDTGSPAWHIQATDYSATGGANGTGFVTGYIDNIDNVHLTGNTILGTCEFDVQGLDGTAGEGVDGIYNNPSSPTANDGTLVVQSTGQHQLKLINKSGAGCSIVGTTATFAGTYTVTAGSASPVITGS